MDCLPMTPQECLPMTPTLRYLLKLALTPELNNLSCWLKANKLSLSVAKTELMFIGSRQRLSAQCDDVEIRIDDQIIKRVDHTKSLGLTIDAPVSYTHLTLPTIYSV